jgi:hypothetical protein
MSSQPQPKTETPPEVVLGGLVLFLTLLGTWIAVLIQESHGHASQANHNAFGHLTALLILVAFTLLITVVGGGAIGLVVGKDNRVSTSKLQVAAWTYAIAGAMLSLVAATWVGSNGGFNHLKSADFDYEDYLVLLGGPFAAAVSARYLIGTKVASGALSKPPATKATPAQAVTNDSGDADLIDSQYLLFNLVALIYFVGAFVIAPTAGLADIPTILYTLTSASAAAYVANKAIVKGAPTITGMSPQKGPEGTPFKIFGTSLLFPTDGEDPNAVHRFSVTVDGVEATEIVSQDHTPSGDDHIVAKIPAGVAPKDGEEPHAVDVKVLNFRGVPSNTMPFVVSGPAAPAEPATPDPAPVDPAPVDPTVPPADTDEGDP